MIDIQMSPFRCVDESGVRGEVASLASQIFGKINFLKLIFGHLSFLVLNIWSRASKVWAFCAKG